MHIYDAVNWTFMDKQTHTSFLQTAWRSCSRNNNITALLEKL